MEWYSGHIAEAVSTIKLENKSLFVYIFDSNDESKKIDDLFDSPELKSKFNQTICLKIKANSPTAQQFGSVYNFDKVPSLHIINAAGQRVATKSHDFEIKSILSWLELASSSAAKTHTRVKPLTGQASEIETNSDTYMTSSVMDSYEEQKAREVRKILDQQKKDKILDVERCRKIKLQIEEDRKETERRTKALLDPEQFDAAAEDIQEVHRRNLYVPESKSNATKAKLNFRLSSGTGGYAVKTFQAEDTMKSSLRPWLKELITSTSVDRDVFVTDTFPQELSKALAHDFEFRQLRPPRRFTPEDEDKPLKELGLCPSALLIIQPKSGALVPSQGDVVSSALNIIYYLGEGLFRASSSVLNIVWGFFSSAPVNAETRPSTSKTSPRETKESRERRHVITQGRINRLSHRPETKDDENARWNGNSTSQL